jgi:hypothetical protein
VICNDSFAFEVPLKTQLFASLAVVASVSALFVACSSSPAVAPIDDDAGTTGDSGTTPVDSTAPDAATVDAQQPDSAVPPPGPTEFPAFEGAFVAYANGGKFFGYKGVAKDVDTDSSTVAAATNVYTVFFNDSANRVTITLPARTPATLDLSATAKVDVVVVGQDRLAGELAGGKIEIVEATDKKIKARFYGDTGGVKVHGAVDAIVVP